VGGTFYWRVAAADDLFANTGDYTATRSFVLPPLDRAIRTATTTTASVTKTKASIYVRGMVSPTHAGKRVTVTLFRKRNGAFATISTKRPLLSAGSGYAARFTRPRSGACRVVSRFLGDADHRASARSISFSC
jgi:hypothetical protein